MNVHWLRDVPSLQLSTALEEFESQFRYPLGPDRTFRISHGRDYSRFYRSMGDGISLVAEHHQEVLGVLGAALKRLTLPNGESKAALYLGDLKTAPLAHRGRVLQDLADAARSWLQARATIAYGVVMDGTRASPVQYTGRLGIPPFQKLASISILRFPAVQHDSSISNVRADSEEEGLACYSHLAAGRYFSLDGRPAIRSETEPLWLIETDQLACGRLEDTLRGKRLFADDGSEIRSAHLACFAMANPAAGAALIHRALELAASREFPALFVAVAEPDAAELCRHLQPLEPGIASATVYGAGLESGHPWNINTSEI